MIQSRGLLHSGLMYCRLRSVPGFSFSYSFFSDARHRVLDKMDETLSTPREGIKEHGPASSKFNWCILNLFGRGYIRSYIICT